jgi:glycosyltransferase involved in cell wall biosynthesis
MEKLTNDTFSLWREEGRQSIPENFEMFHSLVAQARDLAQQGKYDIAAIYGEMAAFSAIWKPCGLFVSSELEQIFLNIGKKVIPTHSYLRKSSSLPGKPKKILHVVTSVPPIAGHSRMVWRWIQQDSDRCHSLVLTRQRKEVPKILTDAVNSSGGKIYKLNETIGSIVSWAKRLREIAAEADMVMLHLNPEDVIPMIAFANKEQSPPIIFFNHTDHLFWLGVSISDLVVNLRESGMHLSQERRSISSERNLLLPIILNPIDRKLSRTEAKRQLGLAENSVLLLSIARPPKYKTIDGISFADAHIPLLKQHEQAILLVIGPGGTEDWSAAIQETQGRIIVLGQTKDTAVEETAVFYQAADIYVDSYPFISNTSLLEAGSYSLPLVTRYPYSDACGIFGADMPGLTGNLIRVRDIEEYTAILSRLVEDEEFRLSVGEATRKKIVETHWGNNWQRFLEDVYVSAANIPKVTALSDPIDRMFLGEPDVFLQRIYSIDDFSLDDLIESNIAIMPLGQRLHHWFRLVKKHGFHNSFGRFSRFGLLVPEWLKVYIRDKLIEYPKR